MLNTFVCAQDEIYYISFTTSTNLKKRENNQNMVNGQRETKEINFISLTLDNKM